MKKYWAVLEDSFREAFASRVLWLVLLLITVLLIAAAPLSYHEVVTWRLTDGDVRRWERLIEQVRTEGPEKKATPSRRIWLLLDDTLRQELANVKLPGEANEPVNPWRLLRAQRDFQKALNALMERPDFYDPAYWQSVPLVSLELRQLRDEAEEGLSDSSRRRFHRLLLEAAYPNLIRGSPPISVQLRYGWQDIGPAQPLRAATLQESLKKSVAWALKWLIGGFGIAVAILVTAPIVPQMFDPGSLHLLLSKPVSRSLVLLWKYVGGCAFILIASAYLIGGMWLILGLRFGVWDGRLLAGIPIYLFVFAVYYSVSTLAGIVWRSPILSIAVAILFFAACWIIGTTKLGFERMIWNKQRIARLVVADDAVFSVNEMGTTSLWDDKQRDWQEVFTSDALEQMAGVLLVMPTIPPELQPIGPVYDRELDALIAIRQTFPPGKLRVDVGLRSEGWQSTEGIDVPRGTFALLPAGEKGWLIVADQEILLLRGDPRGDRGELRLFGMAIPLLNRGPVHNVGPEPADVFAPPAAAASDPSGEKLVIYSRGRLVSYRRADSGKYVRESETTVTAQQQEPALVACAGDKVILGRSNGHIEIRSFETLERLHQFQPEGSTAPRQLAADPSGKLVAVVFHNGRLWCYQVDGNRLDRPAVRGQGAVCCVQFDERSRLWVAHDQTSVTQYDWKTWRENKRLRPRMGLLATSYRYGILPLYTVFPKPGELDKTFDYLLTDEETTDMGEESLATVQRRVDPWSPVWSSALFTIAMLVIACVYFERQEF